MNDNETQTPSGEQGFAPPGSCPNSDVLDDPTPRGRFRIDRRLYIGIFLLLVVIIYGALPTEVWVVAEVDGAAGSAGGLVVGSTVPSGDIEVATGTAIELQLGRRLRLRVIGPAGVYLPAGPGRWFGRTRVLNIRQGRVLGTTGSSPLDFGLVLETARERAALLGGSFIASHRDGVSGFALQEGNMALELRPEYNAEKLIGRYLTISGDGVVEPARYETRSITPEERGDLARLRAQGLPALTVQDD